MVISALGRQPVNAGSWSLGNKFSTDCCISMASLNAAIVRYFFPPSAGEHGVRAVEGVDASSLGVSSSESDESLSGEVTGRRRAGARLTRLAVNEDGPGSAAAPRTTGRLPDNCVGGGGGGGWSSSSSSSSSSIFSSSFSPYKNYICINSYSSSGNQRTANSRHRTSPVAHDEQSRPDHPSSRHFLRSIGLLNQP